MRPILYCFGRDFRYQVTNLELVTEASDALNYIFNLFIRLPLYVKKIVFYFRVTPFWLYITGRNITAEPSFSCCYE
ncbi:hypothetical protein SAMN05421647_11377 [Marinobacterium stanieri]|uniref:Uncharacterized protein n=1 Tax=Marinobacterium stanieri TaxID=49186 RepID=A0A1N6XC22_9GAMM|nr:hypothetical protein SAMN05421647_11377 [Marinobacterium stanieri]